jgi:FixJ family two-component response regulator
LPRRNLVLVVDDDRAVLNAVKRVLRQHGFETMLFPSADAFRNHDDFEDVICVILDLDLKDGSSIPLRRDLKANGISVPVIYITGNDSEPVRKSALQSGCIDYLVKPFSAKSLIDSVKTAAAWPI